MPQAVSIFPTSPPPASRSTFAPSNESGPSKFDNALDSARKTDSTSSTDSDTAATDTTTQSADSEKSTNKSSKSGKAKSTAPVSAKSGAKTASKKNAKGEADPPANDESHATLATAKDAKAADHAAESKSKDSAHSAHAAEQASSAQPAIVPLSANVLKSPRSMSDGSSEEDPDHPSKEREPVEAISGEDNGKAEEADASADAASTVVTDQAAGKHNGEPTSHGAAVQGIQASGASSPDSAASGDSGGDSVPAVANAAMSDADVSATDSPLPDVATTAGASSTTTHADANSFASVLSAAQGPPAANAKTDAPAVQAPAHLPPVPREAQFAQANHAQIVTGIQGQLLPNGGSMQIHLNPGELGSMSVSVHMRDGVMSATFDTSNDQAARLLTHSLGQLKTALESQGMSVGGLHVQQSPRSSQTGSGDSGKGSDSTPQEKSGQQQQEQQRKDMLRKMWRRLNGGKDPLDLVA